MIKKCLICGKAIIAKTNKKFCGNWRNKNSCAYKGVLLRAKRFRDKYRKKRREEQRGNYRNDFKRRENVRQRQKKRRLRLRFLILQRDNFTCRYCGRKAPEVELHIDHKYPKSKGGLDKIENYITSCWECNLGKGDIILEEFNN